MKVLVTSDSHDRWDYLENAIEKGHEEGCEVMLSAGDFMSPPGVAILKKFNGPVHIVLGNNDGELVGLARMIDESENITLHYKFGESAMIEKIGGLTFFMNHYPSMVRNAAMTGNYDVCVYGHDHVYNFEKLENSTILLNPGEIQGYKTGSSTCMIFDTDSKEVTKLILN